MLITKLRNSMLYDHLSKNNIERLFRNRALQIPYNPRNESNDIMQIYESGFVTDEMLCFDNEYQLKNKFLECFFQDDSHLLLWTCRCIKNEGTSLLASLNTYISIVQMVFRGGLNTYKLNGWDVHILYAYQLVSYNFPKNIIPTAYDWDFDVRPIIASLSEKYNLLSRNAQFILRLSAFLHDIGITVGVEDHEKKGIALVDQYYSELGVTDDILRANDITVSSNAIQAAVTAIVGHHQIINQVGAEASDRLIYEKTSQIKDELSQYDDLSSFLTTEFADALHLLGVADLLAVDDSLLTPSKFHTTIIACDYIKTSLNCGFTPRDSKGIGRERFVALLPEDLRNYSSHLLSHELGAMKIADDDFWKFMYDIRIMSYGMTATKGLADIKLILRLIVLCMNIVTHVGASAPNLSIKFNPDINICNLKSILSHTTIKQLLLEKNETFNYSITENDTILFIDC